MRKFLMHGFLVPFSQGALLVAGCSGEETGDDDDDSSVEPTESPTPEPTPEPMDDWYRVTSMAIGDGTQGEGVDLDGDGNVDNNIQEALDTINEYLYIAIEEEAGNTTGG